MKRRENRRGAKDSVTRGKCHRRGRTKPRKVPHDRDCASKQIVLPWAPTASRCQKPGTVIVGASKPMRSRKAKAFRVCVVAVIITISVKAPDHVTFRGQLRKMKAWQALRQGWGPCACVWLRAEQGDVPWCWRVFNLGLKPPSLPSSPGRAIGLETGRAEMPSGFCFVLSCLFWVQNTQD